MEDEDQYYTYTKEDKMKIQEVTYRILPILNELENFYCISYVMENLVSMLMDQHIKEDKYDNFLTVFNHVVKETIKERKKVIQTMDKLDSSNDNQ